MSLDLSQRRRLRRSLRASTADASLHAIMLGCGEMYFAAFALLLGASPLEVGILATLPLLAGSAFQVLTPVLSRPLGHKTWVIGSATLQALTFAPIAGLTVWTGIEAFPALLGMICVYWGLSLGINPAWNAWMGRMIPARIRSRYFGRRSVAVHLSTLVAVLGAGSIIHAAERSPWGASPGFVLIFAIAAASRLGSVWFLSRQHDPGRGAALAPVAWRTVLAGFRHRPYGRLILLLLGMNGAVHVSAAYFTPFMLDALALSYAEFTFLNAAAVVSRVLSSPYWGDIAYTYGNRRALQVSAALIAPLSALWVVSSDFTYLLLLQTVAGFAWAGFELSLFLNFFDCTGEDDRAQVLSLYNLLNGVVTVLGSLVGGLILSTIGPNGYYTIFLLSAATRLFAVGLLARGVGRRLPPSREHTFRTVFLRTITLRPGQGALTRPIVMREEDKSR